MRIGLSIGKIDPHHGGAEGWTLGLAEWLTAHGHEVHLFGFKAADKIAIAPERVHLIAPRPNRIESASQVADALERFDFDIVHDMGISLRSNVFQSHFGSIHALEAAKRNSRSPVQSMFRQMAMPFSRRHGLIEQLAAKQFSQSSAAFVAVSEMVAGDLTRLESIPSEQIRLVKNGIDVAKFHPLRRAELRDESRCRFGIRPDELVLSVLAHNHALKGVQCAVAAVREAGSAAPPLHLLIAGGHRQKYKRLRIGRNVVQYVGTLIDPFPLFAATDVYLHPTFYDACCLSVLEAAACGLPIITSKINGAAERLVHGKSGFILNDPRETAALVKYLRILSDPGERFVMGTAARETAEAWTVWDNFAAVEELYCDVLRGRFGCARSVRNGVLRAA